MRLRFVWVNVCSDALKLEGYAHMKSTFVGGRRAEEIAWEWQTSATAKKEREIKRRRCPSHSRIPKIRTLFLGHFVSMHLRPHSVRNHLGFSASHGATFRANSTRFGPYQIIFTHKHSFGYGNVMCSTWFRWRPCVCERWMCTLDAV